MINPAIVFRKGIEELRKSDKELLTIAKKFLEAKR